MKHTLKITIILAAIFFLAQLTGLVIISQYIDIKQTSESGRTTVMEDAYNRTGFEPPKLNPEEERHMWIFILGAILAGTALVLLIIRFKKLNLWIFWFMMSIIICLYVAISQFVSKILFFVGIPADLRLFDPSLTTIPLSIASLVSVAVAAFIHYIIRPKDKHISGLFFFLGIGGLVLSNSQFPFSITSIVSLTVAGVLTYAKLVKKNIFIHNITEIFLYGGLAALIVPGVAVFAAAMLLIGISLYDMIAVWKTKHMVTMAKFQTESKLFAGLMMSYDNTTGKLVAKPPVSKASESSVNKHLSGNQKGIRTAILGGGDIAFPLIFAGTVMKTTNSFLFPSIIAVTSTIALLFLLIYSEKGKFYPAMPFISAGAFTGYGIVLLLQAFVF